MNNILVTGGAGYIGSHLVELFIKYKFNVVIIDNLITGHKALVHKKAIFYNLDIRKEVELKKIIAKHKIDSVIHLAAYLNVSESQKNKRKYYLNNIIGTKKLVNVCKNTNIKNIIFSSSCSVYGNVNGAVNEKKKLNPSSYYAYTKYMGEELIKKFSKKYRYNYAILRYFNVAGASTSGKIGEIETSNGHLIKNLAIQSIKKNPIIKIFGSNYKTKDGTCVRDYIHVSDLADIHLKCLSYLNNSKKSIILNCGYGKGYSVKEIVDKFKKIKKNLIIKYSQKRSGDVAQVYSDVKKFNSVLRWKPKHKNILKIIKSAIKWEKKLKNLKYF